jgi:hypothetical protein
MQQTQELKAVAQEAGCDLVGIVDLRLFKSERAAVPPDLLDRFASAVSVAVHLDDAIVDGIEGAPTPAYAQHYRKVNSTLDAITVRLAEWIESRGYAAHAIPASQVVDASSLLGAVSHKAVARLAGIGWQGTVRPPPQARDGADGHAACCRQTPEKQVRFMRPMRASMPGLRHQKCQDERSVWQPRRCDLPGPVRRADASLQG